MAHELKFLRRLVLLAAVACVWTTASGAVWETIGTFPDWIIHADVSSANRTGNSVWIVSRLVARPPTLARTIRGSPFRAISVAGTVDCSTSTLYESRADLFDDAGREIRETSPAFLPITQAVPTAPWSYLASWACRTIRSVGTSNPTAAAEIALGRARTLVRLMRADDSIAAALASATRTSCKQFPADMAKQCEMRAATLGQEMDRERLVELLAPFIAAQFSTDEIEAMIRFYDSDEGRRLTDMQIQALNWNSPQTIPQWDRAMNEKVTAYLQSPVARKSAELASQFTDEAKRQVGPYLCTLLEPRGFSCATLTKVAGFGAGGLLAAYAQSQSGEEAYQRDADIVRARNLLEWARIIEAYHRKSGRYPLQRRIKGDQELHVVIATREQQAYLDPASPNYTRSIAFSNPRFTPVSVKELVADIEGVLEREIDERYDPQRAPNGAPIYLSYFATKNGYLIWTVCRTCPTQSNSFSTALTTGVQTINIGSNWFIKNIDKTQSIEGLQTNKEFVEFVGNGPKRAGWFDELERAHAHETKN